MESVAKLIGRTYRKNSIGVMLPDETKTEIFVREESITRSEWKAAGVQGLNPATVLITSAVNYNGEGTVEYNNERYSIYRTFQRSDTDEVELYCEKKVGERQ